MPTLPLLTLLVAIPAIAQASAKSPLTDAVLNETVALGEEIESRADGDLNGDGLVDTAYVVGSPDRRTVNVLLALRGGPDPRYEPIGSFDLDVSRLAPATVSIARGVLKVEDMSGGTTAIAAVYRYRFDRARPAAKPGMRLIGLDATLYSRTYAHDGFEMSWNLLTSDIVTRVLRVKPDGDAAYDKLFEQRFKRASKPIRMEDTPDPEMVMVDIRKK